MAGKGKRQGSKVDKAWHIKFDIFIQKVSGIDPIFEFSFCYDRCHHVIAIQLARINSILNWFEPSGVGWRQRWKVFGRRTGQRTRNSGRPHTWLPENAMIHILYIYIYISKLCSHRPHRFIGEDTNIRCILLYNITSKFLFFAKAKLNHDVARISPAGAEEEVDRRADGCEETEEGAMSSHKCQITPDVVCIYPHC